MTASPELRAAGYEENCDDCDRAVARGHEACPDHYVPTHERRDPRACPTCGGRLPPGAEVCDRCRGSAVR